ncbi:LAQU0S06e03708g1_1 [Lachancea quebecensis]|uniref:LAQU0S06e03708g1_1 n=1 Tax=Lachancea quebecensis TaxID=1654605 RepID=A0A0P1KZ67_9SACH|nr:LAQU0S06e03708g1_1 [Lachancea quebecensis]
MGNHLLEASSGDRCVVGYSVSPGEQFLIALEITKTKPLHVYLQIKNLKVGSRASEYEIPLELSSAVLENNYFQIEIVQASKVVKNTIDLQHYIVINTGDGIHFTSLEQLFLEAPKKLCKWNHRSVSDVICSFHAYNVRGSALQVSYSTRLGSVVRFEFNLLHETFKSVEELNDIAGDCLNSCSPCLPTTKDCEMISVPELIFSCFDNFIYSLESSVMKFPATESISGDQTLVSAAGVVAKQYSTKKLRFYVANMLNSGCHLFKRNANGDWDMMEILERNVSKKESSPLVNCTIRCQGRSHLEIISGSECGKIFRWVYDFRDEVVLESLEFDVAGEDETLLDVQVLGNTAYYMVNREYIGYKTLC